MKPAPLLAVLSAAVLATALFAREARSLADIAVNQASRLGFGQIVATQAPGTVTVTPAGSRTSSGGTVLGSGLGACAAEFTVSGEPNTAYSITLPDAATLTAGGSFMTVDAFTSRPSGSGVLGPQGTQGMSVGATLHVGIAQPQGSYSGTYAVTVTYN
jgi:hypothetical protein